MILPLWLLGILMVGGSAILSVAGLWVVRRRISHTVLREHHDVAGFILAIVGVIYAVLLAFLVLVVWERYGEAEVNAEREANALVDIYRLAPAFGPTTKTQLRSRIRSYAELVITKEWPLMEHGQADDSTSHELDQIWRTCVSIKAQGAQSNMLDQTLDRLTDASDSRRLCLLSSRTGIPSVMWIVLVAGGIITILFTYYFGIERFSVQAGMTALLAIVIALALFLISALNYPFTGDLKVQPEAMQTAIERFNTIEEHEQGLA